MSLASNIESEVSDRLNSIDRSVEYALDIVNLSKKFFRKTSTKGDYSTLKSSIITKLFCKKRSSAIVTQAINDITIRIPKGSSVGIIGRNGSGKSTLLKLITGIYKPDNGTVSLHGRVAALIELGAGFHPDFTGRENLQLGAAMHGLTRKELDKKFDQIVKFAELEDVIDDPVKTYSSGMFMRLGFSLAIHTEPDILIIDEVLAVGDASFVGKCKERIAELRRQKRTLILVSHDLDAVERWCDEVVWLNRGEVRDRGEPRRVIDHYREFIEKGDEQDLKDSQQLQIENPSLELSGRSDKNIEPIRWGSREIEITHFRMLDHKNQEHLLFHTNDKLCIEIEYFSRDLKLEIVFGIGINRHDGLQIHGTNTEIDRVKLNYGKRGTVRYYIDRLGLLEGTYHLDVAVHRTDGYPYDYHKNALTFAVRSETPQVGVVSPPHRWEVESRSV